MQRRDRSIAFCLSFVVTTSATLSGCGGGGGGAAPPAPAATSTTTGSAGPQPAGSADAFVDTIGVNIHLSYYGTTYGDNFPLVFSRLTTLRVRHVRDGVVLGQPNICTEDQQLGAAGIHVDAITDPSDGMQQLLAWASCAGPSLETLEGPNEYDINHPPTDANWSATLRAYQTALSGERNALPPVGIIGPALASEAAYGVVGDLSALVDYGNVHDDFAGHNPGTSGWGGTDAFGTYGSLAWNLDIARQATGGKPIISTETRYADAIGTPSAVPAAIKARYLVRTLFEHWNAHVVRTYIYELLDEGGALGTYGLLDAAGNLKPAYVMLRNLIAHLSDPGAAFTPTSLSYALSADASVHHTLLQKRDGSYCLALWVEASEWDPNANVAQTITPRGVTLTFAKNPSVVTAVTFDDAGNAPSTGLMLSNGSVTLTVTGNVTLVDIKP